MHPSPVEGEVEFSWMTNVYGFFLNINKNDFFVWITEMENDHDELKTHLDKNVFGQFAIRLHTIVLELLSRVWDKGI